MDKKIVRDIIRTRDFSISEEEVEITVNRVLSDVNSGNYDFNNYIREIFTQQGKKRVIFRYHEKSTEMVLCLYLKRKIDKVFNVNYASRNRMMNIVFNLLPATKDMNDFVIIRADFKSFFDSVLTKHVYEAYIKTSVLERRDKEIMEEYIEAFKCCYAGLALSNVMTEIVSSDFDERLKARLSKYGIVIYERYVDDMLVVTNKYISQEMFWEVINETIKEVFGKSPVKINMSPSKFSYIPRREITDVKKMFNFLGYEFQIKRVGNDIEYSYGIAEKKRRRYSGIFERAFIEYKRTGDLELLRQRIKLFASRVVIAKKISSKNYDWLTKGIIANYNELQYHMNRLIPSTEEFLKTQFVKLTTQYFSMLPYFMKESMRGESIYNLYSNMKRNRSIVFEKNIGVSEKTLLKWINQIKPDYNKGNKDYYRIVMDYIEMLKVEQHHF